MPVPDACPCKHGPLPISSVLVGLQLPVTIKNLSQRRTKLCHLSLCFVLSQESQRHSFVGHVSTSDCAISCCAEVSGCLSSTGDVDSVRSTKSLALEVGGTTRHADAGERRHLPINTTKTSNATNKMIDTRHDRVLLLFAFAPNTPSPANTARLSNKGNFSSASGLVDPWTDEQF